MILQWTQVASTAYQLIKMTFPINFSNTNYAVIPAHETSETGEYNANVYINKRELNGVTVHCQRNKTIVFAIGY